MATVIADPFAELHKVARRRGQRGYFTTAQAQRAGVTRNRLGRLVEHGLVVRAAPTVYRFRVVAAATWKDHLAVKLLSTGGLACGLSATALYGLVDPPTAPDVLVLRGSRTKARDVHTTRELLSYERVTVDGLRSLSPMRAILDSLHRMPPADAVTLVESAIVRRLVKPIALQRRAKELTNAKRPGCAVALQILAELHPELERSRNEWEALVVRRARQFGLSLPRLEYKIVIDGNKYFADAAWPEQQVALEFDGRDPHMRRVVHDYDAGRRNDFNDAEWLRFEITATALKNRDDRAFRQVARAITKRAANSGGKTRVPTSDTSV
jgi:Transcriptional regulator, AbiEi antitoxin